MQKQLYKMFSVLMAAVLLLALLPAGAVKADDPTRVTISGTMFDNAPAVRAGFKVPVSIDDVVQNDLEGGTTDEFGRFSFQVDQGAKVIFFPEPRSSWPADFAYDGYDYSGSNQLDDNGTGTVLYDHKGIVIGSQGNRSADGYISGPGPMCKADVTITFTPTTAGGATRVTKTDGEGNFNVNHLDPLEYLVTPSKTRCGTTYNNLDEHGNPILDTEGNPVVDKSVFTPAYLKVDLSDGNKSSLKLNIERVSLMGGVRLPQPGDLDPLAAGLIATYKITGDPLATAYQASVNWATVGFNIENIPANLGGTLTISRVGGAAAFGYEQVPAGSGGHTDVIASLTENYAFDPQLVPNRTITGTIAGQNGVPFNRDTKVGFGGGLNWVQPWVPGAAGIGTAFSIFAQPKLYYLTPVQDGIRSVTPARALANLTAASTAAVGAFNVTLQTSTISGCIGTVNNELPVLANFTGGSAPVRLKAAVGTLPYYYATVINPLDSSCGNRGTYFEIGPLPYGMYGTLEINNHTSERATAVEPQINDRNDRYDQSLFGDRTLSGKVAASSLPLMLNPHVDFINGAGNIFKFYFQNSSGAWESDSFSPRFEYDSQTKEFKAFNLERNKYRLELTDSITGFNLSNLVTALCTVVPTPNPCKVDEATIQVDLTAGDKDLGALFNATRKNIPNDSSLKVTAPVLPSDGTPGMTLEWDRPEVNQADLPIRYEVQYQQVGMSFDDRGSSGDVGAFNEDGSLKDHLTTWTVLRTPSLTYKWRVRAVFANETLAWVDGPSIIVPAEDGAPSFISEPVTVLPTDAGADIVFQHFSGTAGEAASYYIEYGVAGGGPPYGLFHDTVADSGGATTTFHFSGLTAERSYYWRAVARDASGKYISFWTGLEWFVYKFNSLTSASSSPASGTTVTFSIGNPYPGGISAFMINRGVDTRYQVQYVLTSAADFPAVTNANTWYSATPPANWTQTKGAIPAGAYKWRVRLVSGTNADAWPMTDWTNGSTTFNKP